MLRAQAQQPQSRILKVFTDRSLPCCSGLRSLSWAHHPLQAMQKAKSHKLLAAPCPWHKTCAGSYFCSVVWKSSLRLKHRTIRLRRSGVNCSKLQGFDSHISPHTTQRDRPQSCTATDISWVYQKQMGTQKSFSAARATHGLRRTFQELLLQRL